MKILTYAMLYTGMYVPCLACTLYTLHWLAEQRTSNVPKFVHEFVCISTRPPQRGGAQLVRQSINQSENLMSVSAVCFWTLCPWGQQTTDAFDETYMYLYVLVFATLHGRTKGSWYVRHMHYKTRRCSAAKEELSKVLWLCIAISQR